MRTQPYTLLPTEELRIILVSVNTQPLLPHLQLPPTLLTLFSHSTPQETIER